MNLSDFFCCFWLVSINQLHFLNILQLGYEVQHLMRKTIQESYGFETNSKSYNRMVTEAWDSSQKHVSDSINHLIGYWLLQATALNFFKRHFSKCIAGFVRAGFCNKHIMLHYYQYYCFNPQSAKLKKITHLKLCLATAINNLNLIFV